MTLFCLINVVTYDFIDRILKYRTMKYEYFKLYTKKKKNDRHYIISLAHLKLYCSRTCTRIKRL